MLYVNAKTYAIEKDNIIDGILLGLTLTLEVCFSSGLIFMVVLYGLRYLIIVKRYKRGFVVNKTTLWLVVLLFLTTINGLRLTNNSEQFSVIYNLTTFLCVILIQMILLQFRERIFYIVKTAVIFCAATTGIYIVVKEFNMLVYRWSDFLSGNSGYRLGISSNINPNTITWTFGVLALLTIYFAINDRKLFYYVLYIFEIIIIFFTGSKNGLLLAVIPIIIYGIGALRKANLKVLLVIVVCIIALWIILHQSPVLYTLLGRRIDSMLYTIGITNNTSMSAAGIDIGSTEKRIEMIQVAEEMFWKKPLFGWGIGAFAKYAGFGYYCHNNYMEILVSGGIIAFLIYYVFILLQGLNILNIRKGKYKSLACMLLLSLLLLDFSTVNFYTDVIFYFRTVLLAEIVKCSD